MAEKDKLPRAERLTEQDTSKFRNLKDVRPIRGVDWNNVLKPTMDGIEDRVTTLEGAGGGGGNENLSQTLTIDNKTSGQDIELTVSDTISPNTDTNATKIHFAGSAGNEIMKFDNATGNITMSTTGFGHGLIFTSVASDIQFQINTGGKVSISGGPLEQITDNASTISATFANSNNVNNQQNIISFKSRKTNTADNVYGEVGAEIQNATSGTGDIVLRPSKSGTPETKVVIQGDTGNVRIAGDTDPEQALDVSGGIKLSSLAGDPSDGTFSYEEPAPGSNFLRFNIGGSDNNTDWFTMHATNMVKVVDLDFNEANARYGLPGQIQLIQYVENGAPLNMPGFSKEYELEEVIILFNTAWDDGAGDEIHSIEVIVDPAGNPHLYKAEIDDLTTFSNGGFGLPIAVRIDVAEPTTDDLSHTKGIIYDVAGDPNYVINLYTTSGASSTFTSGTLKIFFRYKTRAFTIAQLNAI